MAATKPKRPQPDYIVVHFKNHAPVVIDASTTNCLVWGNKKGKEGYKILVDYYNATNQPDKAEDVLRIWGAPNAKPAPKGAKKAKARDGEPVGDPGVIVKSESCDPQGEP